MLTKADILARLQRDILSLQGFKALPANTDDAVGLGRINQSFPNATFPLSAVHEFFCSTAEDATASFGFVAGILSSLMRKGGTVLWISSSRLIFPPALTCFGLYPEQIIFLDLKKEKEIYWAVEEALKSHSLTAVVGEMRDLSFTESRRFQLAIEKTGTACFVLRPNPRNLATASVTRWQIKQLPSRAADDLPGIGHPRWQVNLLKVRNGKPGSWDLEWVGGRFRHVSKLSVIRQDLQKKTG